MVSSKTKKALSLSGPCLAAAAATTKLLQQTIDLDDAALEPLHPLLMKNNVTERRAVPTGRLHTCNFVCLENAAAVI